MYQHSTTVRVRYAETDRMGFVYYGNYAQYYEIGRVEWIRSLGFSYRKMEEDGIMLPVIRVESKFIHPAQYDDELIIQSTVQEMPDRKITFDVEILLRNKIIHKAKVELIFSTLEGKLTRIPKSLQNRLLPFFS